MEIYTPEVIVRVTAYFDRFSPKTVFGENIYKIIT
jgi:hypothetical protein